MLQLYSDAGSFGKTTFVTVLVLKDRSTFLTFFSKRYEWLEGVEVGEMIGVELGLAWIRENYPEERCLEVFVDNKSVAQFLATDSSDIQKWSPLRKDVMRLRESFEHVLIYHVKAHQTSHNPNKACDMLCSALLRPCKKEA